jgi:catechol 2,3-dioxygenase-like lactoylglutathione lyase family enzyme
MPRVCVIQINVGDMDEAIRFYCDILGFEVKDRQWYPHIVQLEHDGVPLILNKVDRSANIDYPDQAQTLLNIETEDLARAIEELRENNVELLHDTPQDCPVGIFVGFRDPFGNVHELLEFRK